MNHGSCKLLLTALGGAAGGLFYAYFIERSHVRLDRFTIEVDKPGLPPEGVVILHLSDLHCRAAERVQAIKLARLRRLLADEQYDIVAFTGDLIHDMRRAAHRVGLPRRAASAMGRFQCAGQPGLLGVRVPGVVGARR